MIAEIVRRTLEAGKPATTKDANVIDTPEGMTRPPDPHPDIDVVQQALPLPHHPHPPPQSTNDPSIESTPKSQSIKEILLRLLATTIVEPANTLANPKKNALIRAGTEALVMIARMNTPKGNRLVPKRKNANGKNEKRKGKKKEQSSKHKSAISEYGKYGIITEADMFTKDQEFRAWMVEERMLNPETVSQIKMKELFKIYMEDFNTATLPHEKYYALEKYEARMNALRSGEVTTQSDTYDPRADEAALAAQHKRVAKTDGEVYIGRAQLEQLRRIERERVEASRMKRMGMEVKESMGVRYEAD